MLELVSYYTEFVLGRCCDATSEALPGVLGNSGIRVFYFRGTGKQRPNFEGNRGTKTIFGNRENKKTNFRFWGKGEQDNLFQGNKGTPPPPLGGPH